MRRQKEQQDLAYPILYNYKTISRKRPLHIIIHDPKLTLEGVYHNKPSHTRTGKNVLHHYVRI